LAKNSFKASEPYPVTPPGNGLGVNKESWSRGANDIQPRHSWMTSRQRRRRVNDQRRNTDSQLVIQLRRVGGSRHGKTGAQLNPPYSIHSSKKIVRDAVKAWRKAVMAQSED
jgi:hypothetical protein